MAAVTQRVKHALSLHYSIDELTIEDDAPLLRPAKGQKGDSLDLLEMVLSIEDEFGIEIPDEDFAPLQTVRQVSDYVRQRLAA